MSTQPPAPIIVQPAHVDIPCCSPATTESVAVVRDKVGDARADTLVGQGAILKAQGDYTSAILQDSCGTTAAIQANADRGFFASMSQTDKYGLANLQATDATGDRLSGQASTVAWAQNEAEGRRFGEARAQVERINEAQSAQSDRSFKYLQGQVSDSFGRLAAQGENGFYRTEVAIAAADKQIVKSEISLGKSLTAGFADLGNKVSDSYARLSEQNCDLKVQAASNFGAVQLEAAKNKADLQLQAAVNHKESLIEHSKWFALAEKTAMVNKCELEAKLAACCCEIKEVVVGSATATQALIRDGETTRVRDALAAATTENAILRLRREEHHHYPHHGGGSRRGSRS